MNFHISLLLRVLGLVCLVIHSVACTKYAPVPLPVVQLNPNPVERYEITIRIDYGAAAPKLVTGKSTYAVENPKKCLPVDYTKALGGVYPELYQEQSQTYEKIDTHVFRTYIYRDAILNEDYYGVGACNWSVQVITARIVGRDSFQKAGITKDIIGSGKPLVFYCPTSSRSDLGLGNGCMSEAVLYRLRPEAKKHLYKVEFQSRRISP